MNRALELVVVRVAYRNLVRLFFDYHGYSGLGEVFCYLAYCYVEVMATRGAASGRSPGDGVRYWWGRGDPFPPVFFVSDSSLFR